MTYKIIGDSCLDLPAEWKADPHFEMIPLSLEVGETVVTDDDTFDQPSFLKLVKESGVCPKTACPSPERFKEAYGGPEENLFVVTLSEHLSGTYNSALVARDLYIEENGPKNIAVFSSHSASAGELNLALHIRDLCEAGMGFDEVVESAVRFRDEMKTYFVIESLEILQRNGRLTGLKALLATTLNIKPVMGAEEGVIISLSQARGMNRALLKMVDTALKEAGDTSGKRLVIAHCNHPERARLVKEQMCERASFRDVVITETAGVATVYASDGGIIMALG